MKLYRDGKEAPLPTKPFKVDGFDGVRGTTTIEVPHCRVGDIATVNGKARFRVVRVTLRPWTEDDADAWPNPPPGLMISVAELEPV